jgi:hypothetical protein
MRKANGSWGEMPMRHKSIQSIGLGSALLVALVLFAETAPAAAAPVYTVNELLPVDGDVAVQAMALNARGDVVGFSVNALGIASALKWQGGTTEVLYPATEGRDWRGAKAFDINDAGLAVGAGLVYEEHYPKPPSYVVGGAGPIVWRIDNTAFFPPKCNLDDDARKISNAGVLLTASGCVYSVDPADAAFLETRRAVGRLLYENGLVLNDAGNLGQALWGPLPDSPWDDRRFWAETKLSKCGSLTSEDAPWDDYICGLARTGYERSRTRNARGQYIANKDNRAFLYTPVSEPSSLATACLLLAILVVVRRSSSSTLVSWRRF